MSAALALSEAQLQARVIDLATLSGWRVTHFRPAQARTGRWVTPLAGHKGCPDLILARDGAVLLVELKSQRGRTTTDQDAWLAAAGPSARLWRPSDWDAIVAELTAPRSST